MTTKKLPYRKITGPDGALAKRNEFQGNTMSAAYNALGDYDVFSYDTCIAVVTPAGEIIYDNRKYSTTTSKHQSYARAWLPHTVCES